MALNPGPSLVYLTGLHFHLMERPTVALFTDTGAAGIILPALEATKLANLPLAMEVFTFGDDPSAWASAFQKAFKALGLNKGRIAVEPTRLRVLELRYLEGAGKNVQFVDGSALLASLRMCKDAAEIKKMRQAAIIAQNALLETLKNIKVGMSERDIASKLVIQLYKAGSDTELPFQPIVSSGPNSANPHGLPSERRLQQGDLLLFDWGAGMGGYFSDITRVFTVGRVDPELLKIGDIVLAANQAGRGSRGAGLVAGAVDLAARAVIDAAGYGAYFIHRTGHGLGMEAHEMPYIYAENGLILEEGMIFTVEPGIYLPGRGGVRIEDDVVVTKDGLESLTDLPRQVLPLESFNKDDL
ncbi:MAG: Xaa-Pro peptidase family protein [Chloroflexota bacterium]